MKRNPITRWRGIIVTNDIYVLRSNWPLKLDWLLLPWILDGGRYKLAIVDMDSRIIQALDAYRQYNKKYRLLVRHRIYNRLRKLAKCAHLKISRADHVETVHGIDTTIINNNCYSNCAFHQKTVVVCKRCNGTTWKQGQTREDWTDHNRAWYVHDELITTVTSVVCVNCLIETSETLVPTPLDDINYT
jgi:hypothetical protein